MSRTLVIKKEQFPSMKRASAGCCITCESKSTQWTMWRDSSHHKFARA